MSECLSIVKDISIIAAPFIKPLLETFLQPKVKAYLEKRDLDNKLIDFHIENKFEEYLTRTYSKYSYMNTIVFQNNQKKLKDLYLPVTIENAKNEKSYRINGFNKNLIPIYKRILLVDTAGMGKSTLLKFLLISCLEKKIMIPIFIELRRLSAKRKIFTEICNELNSLNNEHEKEFILQLIKNGNFVFFFDGYDEISMADKESVTKDLEDFISKANGNYYIISSRPDMSLLSFSSFQEFRIKPLKEKEAFKLIEKYGSNKEITKSLLSKIAEPETLQSIREFLINPMLVSLLYKAYEFKTMIPYKKHIFYRQVYDSLFEKHDLTKGGAYVREKNCRLDIEDFHRVLRILGFLTMKQGKVEYTKDELLRILHESKPYCSGINFKESEFIKDLVTTVPLFNCEGIYYKWAHKSIQEYFAAQFICLDAKDQQDALMKKMFGNNINKYINVLELCYHMDYKLFRKNLTQDLLRNFLNHCKETYKNIHQEVASENELKLRKALTYGKQVFIFTPKVLREMKDLDDDQTVLKYTSSYLKFFPVGWSRSNISSMSKNLLVVTIYDKYWLLYKLLETREGGSLFSDFIIDEGFATPPDKGVIPINESANSFYNQKDSFSIGNYMCAGSNMKSLLDVEKCKRVELEISNEINQSKRSDFLFKDL